MSRPALVALVVAACALVLLGADCSPTNATLYVPAQPDDRSVTLVLFQGEPSPHPTIEGALRIEGVHYDWQTLGSVTSPQCVRVNRYVARNYGFLCRDADDACVRVEPEPGGLSEEDCP